MKKLPQPTTNYRALVNALYLAVTAPTDKLSAECLIMARDFAESQEQLEKAQAEVEQLLKAEDAS